jgi:hypothetical protein
MAGSRRAPELLQKRQADAVYAKEIVVSYAIDLKAEGLVENEECFCCLLPSRPAAVPFETRRHRW